MTEHIPPLMTPSIPQVPTHWHFWPTASLPQPSHCPPGAGMPWHTSGVLGRSQGHGPQPPCCRVTREAGGRAAATLAEGPLSHPRPQTAAWHLSTAPPWGSSPQLSSSSSSSPVPITTSSVPYVAVCSHNPLPASCLRVPAEKRERRRTPMGAWGPSVKPSHPLDLHSLREEARLGARSMTDGQAICWAGDWQDTASVGRLGGNQPPFHAAFPFLRRALFLLHAKQLLCPRPAQQHFHPGPCCPSRTPAGSRFPLPLAPQLGGAGAERGTWGFSHLRESDAPSAAPRP